MYILLSRELSSKAFGAIIIITRRAALGHNKSCDAFFLSANAVALQYVPRSPTHCCDGITMVAARNKRCLAFYFTRLSFTTGISIAVSSTILPTTSHRLGTHVPLWTDCIALASAECCSLIAHTWMFNIRVRRQLSLRYIRHKMTVVRGPGTFWRTPRAHLHYRFGGRTAGTDNCEYICCFRDVESLFSCKCYPVCVSAFPQRCIAAKKYSGRCHFA